MIHVIYYHATKHRKVANPIGKSHICTCTTKWNRNEINNVILNYKIAVCTPVFCFQLTGCGIRTVAFFLSKPAAVSLLEPTTSGHFPVTSGWHDVTSGWYPTVLERHFRCFTIIAHHFRSLPVLDYVISGFYVDFRKSVASNKKNCALGASERNERNAENWWSIMVNMYTLRHTWLNVKVPFPTQKVNQKWVS